MRQVKKFPGQIPLFLSMAPFPLAFIPVPSSIMLPGDTVSVVDVPPVAFDDVPVLAVS